MRLAQILQGIEHAQRMQEREGHLHPGQSCAFTFPAGFTQRLYLKTQRQIQGLEFVRTVDPMDGRVKWMGCFKPRKDDGNAIQPAHS